MSKYRVGQQWQDSHRGRPQTIIAITNHKHFPIITQREDADGDAWSYTAEGRWPGSDNGEFDLTILVKDVDPASVHDGEHSEEFRL